MPEKIPYSQSGASQNVPPYPGPAAQTVEPQYEQQSLPEKRTGWPAQDEAPSPVQEQATVPPTAPPALSSEPAGASAEELQILLEISAAQVKGLKDDAAAIEKAEKEAKDALEKYPDTLLKLQPAQDAVECFRTHDWKRIKSNPAAQKDKVGEIITTVDKDIRTQETTVETLEQSLKEATGTSLSANGESDSALAALNESTGYAARMGELLKAGGELAAKASKEMTAHPATSYLFGSGAIGYADKVGALKTLEALAKEIQTKLATLCAKADAARKAREAVENLAIRHAHAKKFLEVLASKRDSTIAQLVAELDAKASATSRAVGSPVEAA